MSASSGQQYVWHACSGLVEVMLFLLHAVLSGIETSLSDCEKQDRSGPPQAVHVMHPKALMRIALVQGHPSLCLHL